MNLAKSSVHDAASKTVDILLGAFGGTESARKQADRDLEKVMTKEKGKASMIIAGGLGSKRKTVDVYFPLKGGGALAVSFVPSAPKPMSYQAARRFGGFKIVFEDPSPSPTPTGTQKYFTTQTNNSGMSDTQGDSSSD